MGDCRAGHHLLAPLVVIAVVAGAACRRGSGEVQAAVPPPRPAPVGSANSPSAGAASDDGQWLIPAHDYASTRFSALDQVTTANVGSLKLAWSFSTGVTRGHEGAPLVVGGTMYVVTPY